MEEKNLAKILREERKVYMMKDTQNITPANPATINKLGPSGSLINQ